MKTYDYRGFAHNGRACRGLVEALSIKDAREKLACDGILAERVSQTGRKARFPLNVRAMIYRELGALLSAGLPLVRALDILIQSAEMHDARTLLAGVRDRVREGVSLVDALAEASSSVTAFERAIIEAAEESAKVEVSLEKLAAFLEEQEQLRNRIQGALVYPSIVVTVGICVAVLMLGLLVPRARDMLEGSGIPLPALTRFMMAFGRTAVKWVAPLAVVLVIGMLVFRHKLKHSDEFRQHWDRLLFRIPVLGQGYAMLASLRFSRTLSMLLTGGIPLIDGLILAGRATGSPWLSRIVEREAETVRHGSSLSDAVRRIPRLSQSLPGWISVGEAGGGLERLLANAGERYENNWNRYVSRWLSLLEPVLILVIGGFVLLVTLSVLLPVLSLSRSLGQ